MSLALLIAIIKVDWLKLSYFGEGENISLFSSTVFYSYFFQDYSLRLKIASGEPQHKLGSRVIISLNTLTKLQFPGSLGVDIKCKLA